MKSEKKHIALFASHPEIKKLYRDANGQIWTTAEAAKHQSKGLPFEVIERPNKDTKKEQKS